MSDEPKMSAPLGRLLSAIFRQRFIEPDIDAGVERLAAVAGQDVTSEAWRAAVTEAVLAGYIHDPVRLQAGALQCHWHLELTALGVETVRHLLPTNGDVQRRCSMSVSKSAGKTEVVPRLVAELVIRGLRVSTSGGPGKGDS